MPIARFEFPDGRIGRFEVPEGTTPEQAQAMIAQSIGQMDIPPEPKPQSGLMAAAGSAFRGGVGETAESLGELTGIEGLTKFGKRQQAAAAKAYVPTSEADIEAASKRGLFPELGAYATQFLEPYVQGAAGIAARYGVPTLASMAAPEAAPLLGAAAFAATNAPIHIGEVLKYQKEQGLPRDEESAIVYGLARAGVDSLSGAVLAGPMRGVLGKTAVEQAQALAPRVASGEISAAQAATMVSGRLKNVVQATAQNAVVGTGMMTADEALLRASAGQDITSPEAIKSYEEQAKGAVALAPMFGLLHGFGQPEAARKILRGAEAKAPVLEAPPSEAETVPEPTLRGEQPPETAAGTPEAETLKEAISPKKKAAMDKQLAKEQQEYLKKYQDLAAQRAADQAERDRIAALSPEEYMLEQTGVVPASIKLPKDMMPTPVGFQPLTQIQAQEKGAFDYAAQQVKLAQDRHFLPASGKADRDAVKTYVDYLLVNPDLARQVALSDQPIMGLSAQFNQNVKSLLLNALKLHDTSAKETQAAEQERRRALFTQSPAEANQQLLAAMQESPDLQAQRRVREERERLENIQRQNRQAPTPYRGEPKLMAERLKTTIPELPEGEEPPLMREDDPLLNQLVQALPGDNGRIVPGQIYEGMGVSRGKLKDLQLQLSIARMTNNKLVADRLQAEINDQRQSLKEPRERVGTGEKSAELAGTVLENRDKQIEADKFRDDQRLILLGMFKTLNTRNPLNIKQTRRSATLSLPGVFEKRISDAKDAFVEAHQKEIEARREVFGLPPMADWERAEARARALEALNELEQRWNTFGAPVEAVQVLQQQVRDATNENVLNAAKRFNKEQQETTAEKLTKPRQKYVNYRGEEVSVPEKPAAPRIGAPEQLTLRGRPNIPSNEKAAAFNFIDAVLDQLETRVRAVPTAERKTVAKVGSMEDIAKLFETTTGEGRTEKIDQASIALLNRLRDHLETSTDPEFISLAREQAQRIMEGNLPDPVAVRDLDEMMKGQEVSGRSAAKPLSAEETTAVARGEKKYEAQPQQELFPETSVQVARATPRNFQKLLDSKNVQGMREALAKQKEDNQAVLETVRKYVPSLQKAMQTATASLNKALEKKETLTKAAAEARKEPEWYAPAVRKIVELESALQSIPPRLDLLRSIQRSLKNLNAEDKASLLQLTKAALDEKTLTTKERAEFNEIIQALANPDSFNAEINKLNDIVKNASAVVDNARKTLDDLMTKYQSGSQAVMRRSIQESADKAGRKVERLTQEIADLRKQIAAEREAKEAEEKAKLVPSELETPTEEYETAAQRGREGLGLPGVRVEKDTARMAQNMHKIRSEIGSLNEELRKAEKANDTERIAETKAKIDDAEARLASVYRDAPLSVKELLTPEEERDARDAADKVAAKDAAAEARRRKRKGEAAPKLVPIEQTALLKEVRGSKVIQPYKTARVAEVAQKVTDRLVKQKTELADIQRRIAYLKDNNKHKVSGRLTDTFKDLQGKETLLKEKLKKTQTLQNKIVSVEKTAETLASKAAQEEALRKSKAAEKESERFARGVEVESPDLTPTQIRAIDDNDITAAYADIANDGSNSKINRVVAQRLAVLLDETDIAIRDKLTDKDGKEVLGMATSRVIGLNRNGGLSQEVLLHEGVHAATERIIQMPEDKLTKTQLVAKRELQALHAAIKNDPRITSKTAKGSLSEFVAEVMSNRNLQEQLREKRWKLSDAWEGFKSIILRMLGIDHPETMLGAALQSVDALMVPSSVRFDMPERPVSRRLSQKDIAALHDGSNSMRQFAEQFGKDIKMKDRTPEDVERIAKNYLIDMVHNPEKYVAAPYTVRDLKRRNAVLTKEQEEGLAKIKTLKEQFETDAAKYRAGEPYDEDSEYYKEITKQLEKQEREINILETKMGSLDYFTATRMSDGKQYDPENPLHYVEADAITLANLQAQGNASLRDKEARRIRDKRQEDLESLVGLMSSNMSYTLAENALVAKAAAKYAVVSDKNGRLKLATIEPTNRHNVAVVSLDAADAVIRELRAGKNLKEAFLDGLQASADKAIKANEVKDGWQKFNQTKREETEQDLKKLYTEEEFHNAWMQTGYDFEDDNTLIEYMIADGLLPDRRVKNSTFEKAAIKLNKACAGTSWCTGTSENYARDHTANGDFYIYYKQGRPEVAVRMNGQNEIGEIRGNNPDQALNKEQQEIAKSFLQNSKFDKADKYLNQFELKQKAIQVAKGEAAFTLEDLVNINPVRNGKVDASRLLNFRLLDGQARREDPSEAVDKFFNDKITKIVEDAYEDGHFIGEDVHVWHNGVEPFELNGKKYTPKPDQIKTAYTLTLTSASGKTVFSNLENVKAVSVLGGNMYRVEATLPKVKHLELIKTWGESVDTAVLKLAPGATVDLIREGNYDEPSHITVKGAEFVKSFSAGVKPEEKLFVKLPDAKYVGEHNEDVTVYAPKRIADKPPIEELVERSAEEPRYARRVAEYAPELDKAGALAERLIDTKRPLTEKLTADALGRGALEFETRMVDQFAPVAKLTRKMDSLNGMQMMHFLRMTGQRMNLLGATVGFGAPELRKIIRPDGRMEFLYQVKPGASLAEVAEKLAPANDLTGSPDAAANLFSLYTIAERAKSVGLNKLNYRVTQAELDQAMAQIKAVPNLENIFKNAARSYEKFNRNMVQFGVQTGVFSQEQANKMLQNADYVPYYRENTDGTVSLMMGNEHIVSMGNVKDQPYLHALVGGDQRIADFMTSSVRNANMILDMGLRNQATKSVANELQKIGLAQIIEGKTRAGRDIVQFKEDGKDYFAFIRDSEDVPAELLVKGLEGIPVQTSALLQMAGMPSRLIRNAFLANPISAGRTLFKDTMSSVIASGSGFKGMSKALRDVGDNLMELRGITGGEVFTGLPQDMSNILRQIQTGKPGWESLLAKAFVMHAKADATTRQLRYENYRKQGLSEMEATHMALESMNFTRRGISPSIHVLNTLHPFMNSQIQGLNTLIKAIRGNMTLDEKLKIRDKIIKRGMLLAGATMFYSAMMQDDDTYKNALPEQKYNNFFVPFPGVDEKVRIPIPFEAGILFKSVPEALINYMYGHDKDAAAGMRQAILKLIPAGESYGVPQILLPGVEAGLGKSFYTGRDIESRREQALVPGQRTRDTTTGFAAALGDALNISPIKIDHLINGYTGQIGLAVTQMASSLVFGPKMVGSEVAKHLSQQPIVGSLFQPEYAGAVVEDAYQMVNEAEQVKNTVNDMLKKGRVAEAKAFMEKNAVEYARAQIAAPQFTSRMNLINQQIQAVKNAPNLSGDEKLEKIDQLKKQRSLYAEYFMQQASKTIPQEARP